MMNGTGQNGWLVRAIVVGTLFALTAAITFLFTLSIQHGEAIARLEITQKQMARQWEALGWPPRYDPLEPP